MRLVLALAVLPLLVGCGEEKQREPTAPRSTRLTVTVRPEGDGGPAEARKVTDAGGLRPEDLAPVPATAVCTQIYGGDATATVSGHLNGEPIHVRFSLANGCEIARWKGAAAILGDPPVSAP